MMRLGAPRTWALGAIFLLTSALVGCKTPGSDIFLGKAEVNHQTKFSSAAYGVSASPRLTTSKLVKKGGGRSMVGKPYQIKGKWYYPKLEPNYDKRGLASWYGPNFHGRLTANGEIYDQYHLSAAHPTFPLPSYARVTNEANGRSVIVRVNDRGPFAPGRIVDLSSKAADMLGTKEQGVAPVRVQYVGEAPLHGRDMDYLVASYNDKNSIFPGQDAIQTAFNTISQPIVRPLRAAGQTLPTPSFSTTVPMGTVGSDKMPVSMPNDMLTLILGKKVYIPSGDITGAVKQATSTQQESALLDGQKSQDVSPAIAAPKTAARIAQLNGRTFRNPFATKTAEPTILSARLEKSAVTEPVQTRLTAQMLKDYYVSRTVQ